MSQIPPPPAHPPRISGSEPAEPRSRPRPESVLGRVRRLPRPALIGGVAAVALAGSYLVASLALEETVAPGTTVHGVDIGGLTPVEAERALLEGLSEDVAEPVRVVVGDTADETDPHLLDPAEAGLTLDAAATVEQADRPGLFGRVFGAEGDDLSPVVAHDEDRGRAELELLAAETGTEQTEGGVAFEEGEVRITEPGHGAALDVDAAVPQLADGFLSGADEQPLALPVTEADPLVDADEVDRALTEFAEPAMSGPVQLTADGEQITLTP